mgnify:CR=1 FL=1
MSVQPAETQTIEQPPQGAGRTPTQPPAVDFPGAERPACVLAPCHFIGVVVGLRFGISGMPRLLHLVKPPPSVTVFTAQRVLVQDGLSFPLCVGGHPHHGRLRKRSLGDYGLPRHGAFEAVFEGIVWGFLAEAGTVVVLFLTGNATFSGFALTGAEAVRYAAPLGHSVSLRWIFRRILFRGYAQFTLASWNWFLAGRFLLSGLLVSDAWAILARRGSAESRSCSTP